MRKERKKKKKSHTHNQTINRLQSWNTRRMKTRPRIDESHRHIVTNSFEMPPPPKKAAPCEQPVSEFVLMWLWRIYKEQRVAMKRRFCSPGRWVWGCSWSPGSWPRRTRAVNDDVTTVLHTQKTVQICSGRTCAIGGGPSVREHRCSREEKNLFL